MRTLWVEQHAVPAADEVRACAHHIADGRVLGDGAKGERSCFVSSYKVVAEANEVEGNGMKTKASLELRSRRGDARMVDVKCRNRTVESWPVWYNGGMFGSYLVERLMEAQAWHLCRMGYT
jgi:hypothetical protein